MSVKGTIKAAASEARDRWAPDGPSADAGPVERAAQVSQVIAAVVIGVVALVGIIIFSEVYDAIPTSALEDDGGEMNQFGEAVEGLVDGFGGAMELVPIVILVLIAALVIGVVQRMRGNGGRGIQ